MSEIESNLKTVLMEAISIQGRICESEIATSKIYRENESAAASSIRMLLDGLVTCLAKNMEQKIDETDEIKSYQITASASFVRTHFIVNSLVLKGHLIEAMTLIRKQLELLTRLHELDARPLAKLLRRTLNVNNIFKDAGKEVYSLLSEIAHSASPKMAKYSSPFDGEDGMKGPSLLPQYDDAAHEAYEIHVFVVIYFIYWFIDFQDKNYSSRSFVTEKALFERVFSAALSEGLVQRIASRNG